MYVGTSCKLTPCKFPDSNIEVTAVALKLTSCKYCSMKCYMHAGYVNNSYTVLVFQFFISSWNFVLVITKKASYFAVPNEGLLICCFILHMGMKCVVFLQLWSLASRDAEAWNFETKIHIYIVDVKEEWACSFHHHLKEKSSSSVN